MDTKKLRHILNRAFIIDLVILVIGVISFLLPDLFNWTTDDPLFSVFLSIGVLLIVFSIALLLVLFALEIGMAYKEKTMNYLLKYLIMLAILLLAVFL